MRTIPVVLLILWMVLPCAAVAQQATPPMSPHPPNAPRPPDLGKWWKNSEIARDLQLSESQISQIEQTFYEHWLKLIDLRAELEKQEARLQPLVEASQPDEAKVGGQIDLVTAARGKLEKANALMMLAIRRVLSVEQWKKLEELRQKRGPVPQERMGPPPAQHHAPHAAPRPPDNGVL